MIKNLILDFGDIFINLDKQATQKEMVKFGFEGPTPKLTHICEEYEKGTVSSFHFLEEMARQFPAASKADLTHAWNAILLDFPEYRLEFLEQLANENSYRLFLLSNTNEIHIDFVKAIMGKEKFNRFKNAFEHFYLSYEMGMRKPDIEIFDYVLAQNSTRNDLRYHGVYRSNLHVGKEDIIHLKTKL